MTTGGSKQALRFYQGRYFSASPTFNSWVKLSVAGMHALRAPPNSAEEPISGLGNFADQYQLFYHLNHPIRFTRVVGTVIAIEELNPRFALLTLDDGSGATVEVKITRRPPEAYIHPIREDSTAPSMPHHSNTTVNNVNIISEIGVFDILVDSHPINIGTVLKAKCTINTFRNVHQLTLQRVSIVRSTAEEATCWAETAAFYNSVLARPWLLSEEDMAAIDKKVQREERKRREEEKKLEKKLVERDKRKEEWRKERAGKMKAYEEKAERRRRKEELIMNKGALI